MSSSSRELKQAYQSLGVMENLTEVFQNTASIKIRAIRKQVLSSKIFFNDLWNIYQQLRVETRATVYDAVLHDKQLLIFIASPVGLAGPSDMQIMSELLADHTPGQQDVLVIGSHGAVLLKQARITPVSAFETPDITKPFTVDPILDIIKTYASTTVYYDSYISLTVQRAAKLKLLLAPQELTAEERDLVETGQTEIIAPANYIFEPSLADTTIILEQFMINTTIKQLMLESRLAQLASRFTNMTLAHERAQRSRKKSYLEFLASRRNERDAVAREIIVAARMA